MNEMINGATTLLPLMTLREDTPLYLTISILCFCSVATVNHILPENLDGLTHLVKACFTNILLSINGFSPWFSLISIIDLVPMLSHKKQIKAISEKLLQYPRQTLEMYMIYQMNKDYFRYCVFMVICKLLYMWERQERIRRSNRNDFSFFHCFEHIGLYLLFSCKLNTSLCVKSYAILVFLYLVVIAFFMFFFNVGINLTYKNRLPQFVKENKELLDIMDKKVYSNRYRYRIHNLISKHWLTHLKLEYVTWNTLQRSVDSILSKMEGESKFDLVVGISTGGAFVGAYLAQKLNLPFKVIYSKLWSGLSFPNGVIKSSRYFLGMGIQPKIEGNIDVNGKRILLVDDTTYTGSTIRNAKKYLLDKGNCEVKTFIIWIGDQFIPDYYLGRKRVPIIWEWGAEVD